MVAPQKAVSPPNIRPASQNYQKLFVHRSRGCVRGFWWSVESVLPVGSPGIAVEGAAQGRHAVGPPYPPTRPRLLHPPPDHLLAAPPHQPPADRLALRQPLGITQLTRTVREVTRQFRQRSPLGC